MPDLYRACILGNRAHRHALMEGFEVRLAEADDAEDVSMLVSGMPNSTHIQGLFRSALERGTAVVAAVQVRKCLPPP